MDAGRERRVQGEIIRGQESDVQVTAGLEAVEAADRLSVGEVGCG